MSADATSAAAGVAPDRVAPETLAAEALRLVGIDAALAEVRAVEAIAAAQAVRDPAAESTAWRARGLAARETEQLELAEDFLRRAVTLGLRAGKARAGEARMSLALIVMGRGDVVAARRLARLAVAALSGQEQSRARVQLALIEQRCGALSEAFANYALALTQLRRSGDALWEARLRNNRGILQAYRGHVAAADRDLVRAQQLYEELGQPVLAADVQWNRGFVAGISGDAVAALRLFAEAGERLRDAGVSRGSHFLDRCQVLLSVGLVDEAREVVEQGLALLSAHDVGSDVAEAHLLRSETLLAGGEPELARASALDAKTMFERQGRASLAVLAQYAVLRAGAGDVDDHEWQSAAATAKALRSSGWWVAAADVDLMGVQRAVDAGRPLLPERVAAAAMATRTGPAGQRLRAWHAVALARLSRGDEPGASRALLAGLRVHDRHRSTLSATELQVHTAARARALAETGLRLALRSGDPRRVLGWAERWRAGSLLTRPVQPPRDSVLAGRLTELRAVTAELDRVRSEGGDHLRLERQQRALERAVSDRARVGRAELRQVRLASASMLMEVLGDQALVEYVQVGADLWAVVVAAGRCTLHVLPGTADLPAELEALRLGLARAARGGSQRMLEATAAAMSVGTRRLQALLVEPLADRLGDRPLVLVPTGEMHVLPWALLPATRGRPVSVAPSASVWLAAGERRQSHRGGVVLVAGPGLPGAQDEIRAVASVYGAQAVRFESDQAVAAEVLQALAGSAYAHIAAHGRFRSDNPLFSSLQMADGPLTVHDLETMSAAPSVVVLSACDSGLSAIHPGDELMGLAAALLRTGTRALVASVAPVPDDVARATMVGFHASLSQGSAPAAALLEARAALGEAEQVQAGAFVCFGAG
ncbi:MAG: hypothetical protein QOD91_2543 [Frankiales bacterium]|nr:hypothetical protein [Frankiales bacterium]